MGQTLTHGIYLPDEGERNCYSGLAANWQILDSSVGTIAAHTSALAGKAPLVHTHTVSQITDFPAYGNAAGTICEGNDSRLSDARTPVAHTHTKSDVTDLLNSNFIPSANNSYDLGSSSYQWNNLYAKNYYYNGTAWGLDKANTWSAEQIIEQATTAIPATLKLKSTSIKVGDEVPSSLKTLGSLSFTGSDGTNMGFMDLRDSTLGNTFIRILARQKYNANGNRASNGSTYEAGIDLAVLNDRSSVLNPSFTGVMHLGTTNNKWKTLNGINPGALSLPDKDKKIEIDTTNWTYTGSYANQILINSATQTINGWLYIRIENIIPSDYITIRMNAVSVENPTLIQSGSSATPVMSVLFPVVANVPVYVYLTKAPAKISLYECLGNV